MKTRIMPLDPRSIKTLDVNARYMRHETFMRLVDNIRRDGGIHGDNPLAWRLHDDKTRQPLDRDGQPVYEVISGNHRVMAAVAAGLSEINLVVCDEYLTPDERKAIQLSRNAITGEDDPVLLKTLYESIGDVSLRLYSGLDDKVLSLLDDVQIASLSEASLKFSTLALVFLPDEIEHLNDLMERATKDAPADHYWLVASRDYDRALDGIEAASRAHNIKNTAAAFSIVMDIFEQHVADLRSGYEHASGSRSVPTVAAFGAVALPAVLAQKLQQRLQALDKEDPIKALEKLLEDA